MKVRYRFEILLVLTSLFTEASNSVASDPPDSLRIAAIQMAISSDLETNIARIVRGVGEAAEKNARVVLFPETALSGFGRETIQQLD